jgi:hypothetical protein
MADLTEYDLDEIDQRNHKKIINEKNMYMEIKKLVNKGYSYINSICFLIENFDLKYKDVVKKLDNEMKIAIKKEAIERHLIKTEDKENNLTDVFNEEE